MNDVYLSNYLQGVTLCSQGMGAYGIYSFYLILGQELVGATVISEVSLFPTPLEQISLLFVNIPQTLP